MKSLFRLLLGDRGERTAVSYLKRQGMRILGRGYRNSYGEVDIIALDGRQIVFVEVKTRTSLEKGQPFEAVDRRKQQTLTQIALSWLKQNHRLEHSARFDVVSIVWPPGSREPEITHFRNAFEAVSDRRMFG